MKNRNNLFRNIKKSLEYTKGAKGYCILYVLVVIITGATGIMLPIFSSKVILNITDRIVNQIILSALLVFLIEAINSILLFFKVLASRKIQQAASVDIQYKMIKETLKIETYNFDKQNSGMFIDRLNKDAQDLATMFMEFTYCFTKILSNIGILIAIFILNKYLFVYSIITAILIFLISKKRVDKESVFRKKIKKTTEEKTGLVSEIIRGIRDIKVLNASDNVANQAKKKIYATCSEEINLSTVEMSYVSFESFSNALSEFIFIILGVFLFQKGILSIPAFIIAYNYQPKVRNLLTALSYLLDYEKQFEISSNRVFEIIDNQKYPKEKFGKSVISKIEGSLEFRNVSFSYINNKKVINNISFKINPNEKVAFVGKTGAGKTTIFSLISRLYTVDKGEILLDKVNINDLTCDSLRNSISIISQNPYIFNFSIKDNLLLVKKEATMAEIRKACKLACIDDFIVSLPDGYDTYIGENGVKLSGGQKQRLAIARAFLMKTKIILFDEATSALDNETQKEINKAIENLNGEFTILIVAHRLSTIIDCDKIYVINDGQIVDAGTHAELMKKSKLYKTLYENES